MISIFVAAIGSFLLGSAYQWRRSLGRAWAPHGVHSHVCSCGWAWEHDDRDMTVGELLGDHQDSHECLKCGAVVLDISSHGD